MYKRRKRRASNKNKGKRKDLQLQSAAMSVTTMDVADCHQIQPSQVQYEHKAVGARKRKPTNISKIVEKTTMREEDNMDRTLSDVIEMSKHFNNNNNSPPYKKPCLEGKKNGIIGNILAELKSAKEASRVDVSGHVLKQSGQEDTEYDKDEDDSEDDELRIEEEDDEQCDDGHLQYHRGYDNGNEMTKRLESSLLRTSPESLVMKRCSSPSGMDLSRSGAVEKRSDFADIKNMIMSNSRGGLHSRGSSEKDTDEEESEEGTDLRSVTGSAADDELPFRCGVCAYGSCDKSTLLRHMRTHSGERPFQCRLCYFAFTTKANCERHLRNRHGQIDRDQVRNLVVCLPSSSNGSESETESPVMNVNHASTINIPTPVVSIGSVRSGSEEEIPLDLSMDAVDLSTKRLRGGNSIFGRMAALHRPRPVYPAPDMQNLLVTSPFAPNRDPMVHPQLPLNPFSAQALAHPAPGVALTAHPPHPFSLFPFGAPAGFNPFAIPPANVEKLMNMRSASPPKIPIPFLGNSPSSTFVSRDDGAPKEKESKAKPEPVESKRAGMESNAGHNNVSPSTNSRKRSDNGTSEYQKPKQRRYRTERPFACPHCPARFTLRSNMERHGKHQHPAVWQRSPSNRVINRQKNQQSALVGPPTMVPTKYTSGLLEGKLDKSHEGPLNVNVRAVIAQQLKRKLSNSSLRNTGSETETDPESTVDMGKTIGGDDLASVERLLDRVKSSNFAQYFNDHNERNNNFKMDTGSEAEDQSCDESVGDASEVEECDQKATGIGKKKSAYSSAPHKISCPHCSRRFPWTSSLRRHLLTHTGQKPFQCPQCPLLFTTKSNCDRHLARKHNGQAQKQSSDNSTEEEEDDEAEEFSDDVAVDVKEDETASNSNQDNVGAIAPKVVKTATTTHNGCSPGEDAAFRCHLCEAAAGERETLLTHMEDEHKAMYDMLVAKGALSSSPPSENSETEQGIADHRDVTHRKVMCVFCIRRFWSVEDLRRHIRSHSGERPFSCPFCSRRFTLKHSMLRHLKKHTENSTPSRVTNSANVVKQLANRDKGDDLIGRLLGLNDDRLVEQLLNKPDAKDAAKILGLVGGLSIPFPSLSVAASTK